ncbi:hypothetical protein ZN06_02280 [Salmonella enterica]|nr:hypothetical protein [Salmonella enterica]
MGQKFFDMQESSRLNMSFNCSGAFNIIYIMRTNGKDGGIWRSAAVLGLVISLRLCQLCSIITDAVVSNYAKRMAAPFPHQFRVANRLR